ncbi:MAG: tyrosine-type recombinase/integrase [Actinomycetes bacterium]
MRTGDLRSWVAGRSRVLAPSTLHVVSSWVRAILSSAVDDGLIAVSPWRNIALPRIVREQVEPWPTDTVLALIDAVDERYRAAVVLAAGTGLRQGEMFGVDLADVDFLRRQITVRRQVRRVGGVSEFGPTKSRRTRTIPLPDIVTEALSLHVKHHPPVEVTLPWVDPDGPSRTQRLLFVGGRGAALRRDEFNRRVWHPALRSLGTEPTRATGMHQLRHYYASVLIDAGESPKVIQQRLGHASVSVTFDVYGHLFPESEDRTRAAVDGALGRSVTERSAGILRDHNAT